MRPIILFSFLFSINIMSQTNTPIGLWKEEAMNGDTSNYVLFKKNGIVVQKINNIENKGTWKVSRNKLKISFGKSYKRIISIKNGINYEENLTFYSEKSSDRGRPYIRKEYLKPKLKPEQFEGKKLIDKSKSIDEWLLNVDSIVTKGDKVIKYRTIETKSVSIEFHSNKTFYYNGVLGFWNINDKYLTLSCYDWNGWWHVSSKTWKIMEDDEFKIILKEVRGRKRKIIVSN